MTDRADTLLARAMHLEEENKLLRSLQSPSGDEAALRAENLVLRRELDFVRQAAPGSGPDASEPPDTIAEFNALSAEQRVRLARRMTRGERNRLLGRSGRPGDSSRYL